MLNIAALGKCIQKNQFPFDGEIITETVLSRRTQSCSFCPDAKLRFSPKQQAIILRLKNAVRPLITQLRGAAAEPRTSTKRQGIAVSHLRFVAEYMTSCSPCQGMIAKD